MKKLSMLLIMILLGINMTACGTDNSKLSNKEVKNYLEKENCKVEPYAYIMEDMGDVYIYNHGVYITCQEFRLSKYDSEGDIDFLELETSFEYCEDYNNEDAENNCIKINSKDLSKHKNSKKLYSNYDKYLKKLGLTESQIINVLYDNDLTEMSVPKTKEYMEKTGYTFTYLEETKAYIVIKFWDEDNKTMVAYFSADYEDDDEFYFHDSRINEDYADITNVWSNTSKKEKAQLDAYRNWLKEGNLKTEQVIKVLRYYESKYNK